MSKYRHLIQHLEQVNADQVPMTFLTIEGVLEFNLPRSARRYQAWWANTDSHAHAVAWMKRGWRTSSVDLAAERVVFVRAAAETAAFGTGACDLTLRWSELSEAHQRLLTELAGDQDGDLAAALRVALDMAMRDRRRRRLDWFAANSPPTSSIQEPGSQGFDGSSPSNGEDRRRDEC